MSLRVLTYLAPGLPAGLFEALADHLGDRLGRPVDLRFDPTRSGPRPGESEPFTSGEVDLAFVCATSYVWLTAAAVPPIELVGAAWAPTDPRSAGRAVYRGDVLAPRVGGVAGLADLAGRRVAYNDEVSLSGYHSLRLALAGAGVDDVELVCSGGHLPSLELLAHGRVDAAAVDANVWRRRRREQPALADALHEVAELGPHPVQPPVVRRGEPAAPIRSALLEAQTAPRVAAALADAELTGFVPVDDGDYAELRGRMRALGVDGAAAAG